MTAHAAAASLVRPTTESGRFPRILRFAWKLFLGGVFCTKLLLAVLVVGWTYRAMDRRILKEWWSKSPARRRGLRFEDLVDRDHHHWPNWVLAQDFLEERKTAGTFTTMARSLVRNAQIGVCAIFNTWLVTLPGCALWLFAWFSGWNNSFHKGYEHAFVGPAAGVLGAVLFVGAMWYVPFAQARHAVSHERRRFFDFALIGKLARRSWPAALAIAALYSLVSIPFSILFALPTFFPQISPELGALSGDAARAFLARYYFWVSMFGFAAYAFLRLVTARFYAGAVRAAVAAGDVSPDELSGRERTHLDRFGLLRVEAPQPKPLVLRAAGWTGRRLRILATFAILFVWFTFVAQIFVREFFHYHPVIGWLNQVFVQIPFFAWIPSHLGW